MWLLCLLFATPAWPAQMAQEVVLVLDNSGSMRKNDPGFLIKNAVTVFVNTLDKNARLAVLIFGQNVNWVVPFTEINDASKPEILSSLDRITYDGLYTNSRAAMAAAADELNQATESGAKKIIVFLTDGIVDTGDTKVDAQDDAWLRGEFASDAETNGISVIGVAFTKRSDQALVRTLADETGGTYYSVPAAQDLEETFTQAALLIKSMTAETESVPDDETEEDSIDVATTEEQAGPQALSEGQLEKAQEAGEEQLPTNMDTTPAEESEPVVADVAVNPEQPSPGDMQAGTGDALQDNESTQLPVPAASDKTRLLYLVVALVVAGIIVIFFILYTRSRNKVVSAAAPTQIYRAARQTPEEGVPQAYLDDLDKVTSKPRHKLHARKTVITRTKEIEDSTAEHIRIPRQTVSRLHAAIEYESGAFWLTDYESSNGTYQNDHKVTGRQRLHDGDQIRFDTFNFRFVAPESQASDATVFHPAARNSGDESKTVVTPAKG